MAIQVSVAAQNAVLDAIAALVDAGTGAIIETRTGAPPATTATADSGTLLATNPMSATAFAAAAAGVIQENAITDDTSADADGTPGHFRVKTQAGGTVVIQGTAGVGSGDLSFNAAIELGGTVSITNFAFTSFGA